MAKAIHYPFNGSPAIVNPQSYAETRALVGGTLGYLYISEHVSAYCDDNGLFERADELNEAATRAVVRLMEAEQEGLGLSWLAFNGVIRGDVLVIGPADSEGETLDVPDEAVALLGL